MNAGTSVTETTSAAGSTGISGPGDGTANANGNGDIIVAAPISWSTTAALTLSAYRNVDVNAAITLSGGGKLTLYADNAATGLGQASGTVMFGTGGSVSADTTSTINIDYNPVAYNNAATNSTQNSPCCTPVVDTNPYSSNVVGGVLRAYMLVDILSQLGGGLTGVGGELDGLYALNANIDASATATANPLPSGGYAGLIPIGYTGSNNQTNGFAGVFDGQGHTIANLYIHHQDVDSNGNPVTVDDAGLFGMTRADSLVDNLGLVSPTVVGSQSNNGALIGFQSSGTVDNVFATGVNVTGGGYFTGGLIGQLYASLTNAYTTGVVKAFDT